MSVEELDLLKQNELAGSASQRVLEAEEGQNRYLALFGRNLEEGSGGSIDGIWTCEIFGPYGWEDTGTYVLERGRILGGNSRHHSAGHYSFVDGSYRAEIAVRYHGRPRAIFGQRCAQFEIVVLGSSRNGVIEAEIERRDKPGFSVQCRMKKRSGLPGGNHDLNDK